MPFCSKCGTDARNNSFCGKCGTKIVTPSAINELRRGGGPGERVSKGYVYCSTSCPYESGLYEVHGDTCPLSPKYNPYRDAYP